MMKPVPREDLEKALESLHEVSSKVRRVLVVEDDPRQLESIGSLLSSEGLESVGVKTAAECLEKLAKETFDCMVLDLSLPDSSGFGLLERLSEDDRYSFPPAIVYTGRELSDKEEEQLRRLSKSIIIKGPQSPDRLLDELGLFLRQVVPDHVEPRGGALKSSSARDDRLRGRHVLVVEDDVRNVFALTSILEPQGLKVQIARNGREALEMLERTKTGSTPVELVLMDIMMPEMDGLVATREIRKRSEWKKLPIIALTAKAMKIDQEEAIAAGVNDYMSKPIDVDKLLSLIRVWMPR
jgi:CheY-like chemotaxis protein